VPSVSAEEIQAEVDRRVAVFNARMPVFGFGYEIVETAATIDYGPQHPLQ
jgi:hypothetical protein